MVPQCAQRRVRGEAWQEAAVAAAAAGVAEVLVQREVRVPLMGRAALMDQPTLNVQRFAQFQIFWSIYFARQCLTPMRLKISHVFAYTLYQAVPHTSKSSNLGESLYI